MQSIPIVFLYGFFVILPVFFWFWFFGRRDRAEPEPRKLLFQLFLWGFLAAIIAFLLEVFLSEIFYGEDNSDVNLLNRTEIMSIASLGVLILFVAIEEIVKFFILKKVVYYSEHFTQIIDGALYGICLALGFSFIENTGYFFDVLFGEYTMRDLIGISFLRSFMPLLLHIVATGICGLYLARKKFSPEHSQKNIIKGLFIAISMHGIFNISVLMTESPINFFIALAVLFLGLLFLLRQISKGESKMIWKLIYK
ncbi:MAG: PrsW family intramembrane metalloprotease [Candidatus Moraniibacteriota bacterium]|nr:MAG: PrsW family intramembrane metalloprotease [Candidatus Moranbacteria bacterium]